ncbi:MAG: hypothetical protein E7369_03625 [Clostridiales bacterium]|nr:hypothetical protein [Clostridiales bacterium]
MNYFKKVLIIKEVCNGFSGNGKPLSGICRLESEVGVQTISLSFINVSGVNGGEYVAYLMFKDKYTLSIPLGIRPSSLTRSIDKVVGDEFCVGLFFIKDDLPLLIAFATTSNVLDQNLLKKTVVDKILSERKFSKKPTNDYDDEAVATENYFLFEDKHKDHIVCGGKENGDIRDEDDVSYSGCKEKTKKESDNRTFFEDETNASFCEGSEIRKPYYLSAKAELDKIFLTFPKDELLSRMIEESQWARINYTADKYYVVGVVKENGKEKFICYGVPAPCFCEPPKELKGYCSFVPQSVFDLKGKGYWMMFQDAFTGECVKPNG